MNSFREYLSNKQLRPTTVENYTRRLGQLQRQCDLDPLCRCAWLRDSASMERVKTFVMGQKHDARINWCCVLKNAADMVDPESSDIGLQPVRNFAREVTISSNLEKKDQNKQQKLMYQEVGRWKGAVDLERNLKALEEASKARPDDFLLHLRYLLYALYLGMKDICVFRLDVVYKTVIGYKGDTADADNHVTLGRRGEPATFTFTDYKTTGHYGTTLTEAPKELSEILEDSYRRFPRRYLFPVRTDTNKPMVQANAARFVESAWILNKEKGPSANDIRSALTTRFFLLNMDIVSRERFARRSMSNYQNMEAQYFKVHESSTRSLAFDD